MKPLRVAVAILSVLLAACSASGPDGSETQETDGPPDQGIAAADVAITTESVVDPLATEAQEAAENHFRTRIIKCGDSHYFYETNWLSEIKGGYNVVASGAPPERKVISLADSLNGVRQSPLLWKGEVQVTMGAHHTAASEGGAIVPTSYQTAWQENHTIRFKLEKHPSGWKVLTNLWEITCADVDRVLATGQRGRNAG